MSKVSPRHVTRWSCRTIRSEWRKASFPCGFAGSIIFNSGPARSAARNSCVTLGPDRPNHKTAAWHAHLNGHYMFHGSGQSIDLDAIIQRSNSERCARRQAVTAGAMIWAYLA